MKMNIDIEKSIIVRKLSEHLEHLHPECTLDILLQLSIKIFINYANDKDVFMEHISDMYDWLEEHANILGSI